jgi:hypothetical protein
VPNSTLCYDEYIARVGFMDPDRVGAYARFVELHGLTLFERERFKEFAVVDQMSGPTAPCDWLEFGRLPFRDSGHEVSACWFMPIPRMGPGLHIPDTETGRISVPDGWTIDDAQSMVFVPNESVRGRLRFLRYDGSLSVFRDEASGEEVFLAGGQSAIRAACAGMSPVAATLWTESFSGLNYAMEVIAGFIDDPDSIEDADRAWALREEMLIRLAMARRGFERLAADGVRGDLAGPLARASHLLYEGTAAANAEQLKEGVIAASYALTILSTESKH